MWRNDSVLVVLPTRPWLSFPTLPRWVSVCRSNWHRRWWYYPRRHEQWGGYSAPAPGRNRRHLPSGVGCFTKLLVLVGYGYLVLVYVVGVKEDLVLGVFVFITCTLGGTHQELSGRDKDHLGTTVFSSNLLLLSVKDTDPHEKHYNYDSG